MGSVMVPIAYLHSIPKSLPKDQEEYFWIVYLDRLASVEVVRAARFLTVSDGIAMKRCLREGPPAFMRPLLIMIYPCLGNNSFQESEVAHLVIPAQYKCVHENILELQIRLPKGEELTLCILTVKAEHRPKQKHLLCVGGNLGQ